MADIDSTQNVTIFDDDTLDKVGVSSNRLKTIIVGTAGNNVEVSGEALQVISQSHAEIHDGNHYTAASLENVSNGTSKYFLIKVPTGTQPNVTGFLRSDSDGTIYFYENPTISANGTSATPVNNNRNSSNTSALSFYKDPTVTSVGTPFYVAEIFKEGDSEIKRSNEFILKENEDYLFEFLPDSDGTINLVFEWYEVDTS